jgi:hypothetical protein
MLRTVSGIGTVRAKSAFAKEKIGRQATGTSCHWRKLICLFDSEGGGSNPYLRFDVESAGISQKPRVAASACCASWVIYAKNSGD